MLKSIFENEWVQYLVTGVTSLVILTLMLYFAPLVVLGTIMISFFLGFSFALGFIIVELRKNWTSWDK